MKSDWNYVYLMYRKDKGYRIGIASHARSNGTSMQVGLQVRSNQENAHKMWVLKVCEDRNEAYYWETYFSTAYSIPTSVFHAWTKNAHVSGIY
jgi:DNA helicase-2/ATP-dependent DNA helicase PcrA